MRVSTIMTAVGVVALGGQVSPASLRVPEFSLPLNLPSPFRLPQSLLALQLFLLLPSINSSLGRCRLRLRPRLFSSPFGFALLSPPGDPKNLSCLFFLSSHAFSDFSLLLSPALIAILTTVMTIGHRNSHPGRRQPRARPRSRARRRGLRDLPSHFHR